MTTPMPDEKTERTRNLLVAGIVVLAVFLVGLGAWALLRPKPKPPGQVAFTPAQETTASTEPTQSSVSSDTSGSQSASATSSSGSGASTATPAPVRAAKIAFLLGNSVVVADEDGGNAKPVTPGDTSARFSLSPDGATLAVVSGLPQALSLVDVATGRTVRIPGAIPDLPDWAPDSSWVAYTASNAGTFSVRRVNRDGSADALVVTPGADPEISPDGTRVAYLKSNQPGLGDPLYVLDVSTGATKQVPKGQGSLHWAWAPDGSLYFVQAGKAQGSGTVALADTTLSTTRVVGQIPGADAPASPGDLFVSPGGNRVLLTRIGDDGYSRMLMMDAASGKVTAFPTRHDQYPLGWTLDGKYVLFIEGNAFQEETTALWRANPDGTGPRILVTSAGS